MLSQASLNSKLKNPFVFYSFKNLDVLNLTIEFTDTLQDHFEDGKIIILEDLKVKNLDFFIDLAYAEFKTWVPPLEDDKILNSKIDSQHVLWNYFGNNNIIESIQSHLTPFQKHWSEIYKLLFPRYIPKFEYWSWRLNKMDLGYLHFDVPPPYPEHQMRSFMNLSTRPRILEIGPTLEDITTKFYDSFNLDRYKSLNTTDYLTMIKKLFFKDQNFENFHLPRHILQLAPGAIWISHSSLISHGLIFGEKTVCLESRIPSEQIKNVSRRFDKVMQSVKNNTCEDYQDFELFE
jgi:hypothetical protein